MIYEMTTVDVIPGKLKEFHDMWLKESLPVWEAHGAKHIGSWETVIGNRNEVVRIFAFNDLTHYDEWRRFISGAPEGKELARKVWTCIAHLSTKIMRSY